MWTLKLSRQAYDFYESLTGKHKLQVSAAFTKLEESPYVGKQLKGELKGFWSLRVGVYRIIYSIINEEVVIEVLRIQHRKEAYERFRGR